MLLTLDKFLAFAEEEKKKTQNALAMWSILESVALFFTGGDMMQWHSMLSHKKVGSFN